MKTLFTELSRKREPLTSEELDVVRETSGKVASLDRVEMREENGVVYVSGPYRIMADEINPRLKSQGFRWNPTFRRWEIPASKLTPLKRKNLTKLIEPFTAPGSAVTPSPREKALEEIRLRREKGFCLDVPFDLRDEARALGGLWDPTFRLWYLPDEAAKKKLLGKIEEDRERARSVAERHLQEEREKAEAERLRLGLRTFYYPSDSRGGHPAIGSTFKDRKTGDYMEVVTVKSTYYSEDGLSFGIPDDRGWMHVVTAKPSGDAAEIQKIQDREREKLTLSEARNRRKEIVRMFTERGDFPSGSHSLHGDRLVLEGRSSVLYGGGDWFVAEPSTLWYVRNNGADGDDWGRNNVSTGGAGAMGWRLPATDSLEKELRALDVFIGEG